MQEIFGPYQLIERIASGGMAEIFKARTHGQFGFEKTLAIKRLHPRYTQHPEFVEMLKQEAKIAVGLSHANIVQIFDLGRVQEHFFIAMEYIHGRDLNQTINRLKARQGSWPLEAVLHVMSQVCSGLDHAHRLRGPDGQLLRIVHRDVTPQNVMISTEGDVKLVDFGIAKITGSQLETEAGMIKGKFCFMSPEQAMGARLDHRTDIFSAGILMYELLAGQPMYEEGDERTLIHRVRQAQYTPLAQLRPDLPRAVIRVLNKALAPRLEDRFPSARHFQHALDKLQQKLNLPFSNLKLKNLITETFPELQERQAAEHYMQSTDDFGGDELSLISDYELSLSGEGGLSAGEGWDVPEVTDELDFIDVEEVEPEELDESVVNMSVMEEHALDGAQLNAQDLYSQAPPPPQSPYGAPAQPSTPPVARMRGEQPYAGGPFASAQVRGGDAHGAYGAPAPISVSVYPPAAPAPVAPLSPYAQQPKTPQQSLPQQSAPQQNIQGYQAQQHHLGFDEPESTMILPESASAPSPPALGGSQGQRGASTSLVAESSLRARVQSQPTPSARFKAMIARSEARYVGAGLLLLLVFGLSVWIKRSAQSEEAREPSKTVSLQAGGFVSQRPQPLTSSSPQASALTMKPSVELVEQPRTGLRQGELTQGTRPQLTPQVRPSLEIQPSLGQLTAQAPYNQMSASRQLNTSSTEPFQAQPAAQQPLRFTMEINSDPVGAEVAINQHWQANPTPVRLQVFEGQPIELTLSKRGYQEMKRTITPRASNPSVRFRLQEERGQLIVTSDPPGAEVVMNGEVLGETPLERSLPLSPVDFTIELVKQGYVDKTFGLRWSNAEDGTLELKATLEAKPQRKVRRAKPRRARRTSKPARRTPKPAPKPVGRGFISVRGPQMQWGHVYIDGRFVKETQILARHPLSAGPHTVKFCVQGNRSNCLSRRVNVQPEAVEKVFF